MRLDNERPSANVEDQRGQGGFSDQGSYGERMGFPSSGTWFQYIHNYCVGYCLLCFQTDFWD